MDHDSLRPGPWHHLWGCIYWFTSYFDAHQGSQLVAASPLKMEETLGIISKVLAFKTRHIRTTNQLFNHEGLSKLRSATLNKVSVMLAQHSVVDSHTALDFFTILSASQSVADFSLNLWRICSPLSYGLWTVMQYLNKKCEKLIDLFAGLILVLIYLVHIPASWRILHPYWFRAPFCISFTVLTDGCFHSQMMVPPTSE